MYLLKINLFIEVLNIYNIYNIYTIYVTHKYIARGVIAN